jgi:ABC-type phosphate/phosphonate transport system substrate-binding protein
LKKILSFALLWASLASAEAPCPPGNREPVSGREFLLGVGPFLPPERLELTFAHMATRFSEALHRGVRFQTSTTFERFTENVLAEEYDFALLPPFLYVQLDPGSYVPLARAPGVLRGEFVTLESSPVEKLNDLRGKTVAIAPQHSGMEYLARHTLLERGLDPDEDITVRYFESALSCLQQLPAATAAACVTHSIARERFEEELGTPFKVIAETVGIQHGPLAAHCRVPEQERDVIRKLLMTWAEDPGNRLPVSGAQVPSMVPVDPGDYDAVIKIWRDVKRP